MREAKRARLREMYKSFSQAWQKEKYKQQFIFENGGHLPEGVRKLERKPTLKEFLHMINNLSANTNNIEVAKTNNNKSNNNEENISLDWE